MQLCADWENNKNINNKNQTDWSYKSYGQFQVKIRAASNPTTFCSLAYSPDENLTPSLYFSNISPLLNPLALSADDLGCYFTEKIEALRLELLPTVITTPTHQTVPTARCSAVPADTRLKCQCFSPRPFSPPLSIRFPTLLAFPRKSLWHLFSLFLSLSLSFSYNIYFSSFCWTMPVGKCVLCSQRWRSSIQSKTRPGADCGPDHELLITKFRLKLKKVGKTARPFRYDLNQIPDDYTVEMRNRLRAYIW